MVAADTEGSSEGGATEGGFWHSRFAMGREGFVPSRKDMFDGEVGV